MLVNEKFINSRVVPFPAVTICSPQLVKSKYSKILDTHNITMDDDDLIKNAALAHICRNKYEAIKKIPGIMC